MHQAWRIYNTS